MVAKGIDYSERLNKQKTKLMSFFLFLFFSSLTTICLAVCIYTYNTCLASCICGLTSSILQNSQSVFFQILLLYHSLSKCQTFLPYARRVLGSSFLALSFVCVCVCVCVSIWLFLTQVSFCSFIHYFFVPNHALNLSNELFISFKVCFASTLSI